MASQCPKCHQWLEEDYVCCAGIEFQWRCGSCQKRTRGFAIPFGRCLCGGELVRVDDNAPLSQRKQIALQEAFQIEINAVHFYRHLAEAVDDPQVSDFFESMSEMEKGHARELSDKYHLHLDETTFKNTNHPLPQAYSDALSFFADTGDIKRLYDCAIKLENTTLTFFLEKSNRMPEGNERELYLELAAEEREHIAMLESERDR